MQKVTHSMLCIGLIAVFSNLASLGAWAQTGVVDVKNSVHVGPAVIGCCKHICFYRPVNSHLDQMLDINYGDKNFSRIQQWIFDNLYGSFNRPNKAGDQETEYVIQLFAQKTGSYFSPMDVLLSVPLNSNTLGPGYQSKIIELRKLLTDQAEKGD